MQTHVGVQCDLVQLDGLDVVVVTLQEGVQLDGDLLDRDTSDLASDLENTGLIRYNAESGTLLRERRNLTIANDTTFGEYSVLELERTNTIGSISLLCLLCLLALLVARVVVKGVLAILQVILVLLDLLFQVGLMRAQTAQGTFQALDFLLLVIANRIAVDHLQSNIVHERVVVVILGNTIGLFQLADVFQNLVDVVRELLVLLLCGKLETMLEHIHQIQTLDTRLDRYDTKNRNQQLLGGGVQSVGVVSIVDVHLEAVGERQLNITVVFVGQIRVLRCRTEIGHHLAKRIVLIGRDTLQVGHDHLVGLEDFTQRDLDHRLGLVGELHVLVHLKLVLRVVHLHQRVKVLHDGGLVLGDKVVHGGERRVGGERTQVEHVLQHLGHHHHGGTRRLREILVDDLGVGGVGRHNGQVEEAVVHKVAGQFQNVLVGGVRQCLLAERAQLLADPAQTVGQVVLAVEDGVQEETAHLLEVAQALRVDLGHARVLQRLLVGDVSLELTALTGADLLLVTHGGVDALRVQVQIEILVQELVQRGLERVLQVLHTGLTAVVGDDHLGHHRVHLEKVTDLLDHGDLVLDGQLEQLQNQVLLTRRVGVTVQREHGGLEEALHLVRAHQVHHASQVARLGLQHVEEVLVVLDGARVELDLHAGGQTLLALLVAAHRVHSQNVAAVLDQQGDLAIEHGEVAVQTVVATNLNHQLLLQLGDQRHQIALIVVTLVHLQHLLNLLNAQLAGQALLSLALTATTLTLLSVHVLLELQHRAKQFTSLEHQKQTVQLLLFDQRLVVKALEGRRCVLHLLFGLTGRRIGSGRGRLLIHGRCGSLWLGSGPRARVNRRCDFRLTSGRTRRRSVLCIRVHSHVCFQMQKFNTSTKHK
mmetsp:Transcript_33642/g.84460  ORF Transcript_33642/g.84460 Transcript_33642/m.84460 type:complete len:874 (-) Transcript_33642:64-2685(-)